MSARFGSRSILRADLLFAVGMTVFLALGVGALFADLRTQVLTSFAVGIVMAFFTGAFAFYRREAANIRIQQELDELGRANQDMRQLLATAEHGRRVLLSVLEDYQQAQAALALSEARLAAAQARAHLGSWEIDLESGKGTWSAEHARLHGRDPSLDAPTFPGFLELVHPEDRAAIVELRAGVEQMTAQVTYEYRTHPLGGPLRHLAATLHVVRNASGRVTGVIGTTLDITDHKRAALALRQTNARLQALSDRMLDIQESERRYLAGELHDEIGQALTAAKINLQSLRAYPDAVATRLDDSIGLVARALEQVRSLSLELRPPMLDDLGLVPTLRWLLYQHVQRSGLDIVFTSDVAHDRVGGSVGIACFRIAQEALTNVTRHSGARHMTVDLHEDDAILHLHLRDDGQGFDVEAARHQAVEGASLGLLGMEERASLAGGGVEWRSASGQGTEVHAWFALPAADAGDEPAATA